MPYIHILVKKSSVCLQFVQLCKKSNRLQNILYSSGQVPMARETHVDPFKSRQVSCPSSTFDCLKNLIIIYISNIFQVLPDARMQFLVH